MAKDKKSQSEGKAVDKAGEDSPSAEKKVGKGLKKREVIFLALAFVIMLIIAPYMYYTRKVYLHIHSDAAKTQAGPEFTNKPYVTDFWISIASGFVFFWAKKWVTAFMHPIVRRL